DPLAQAARERRLGATGGRASPVPGVRGASPPACAPSPSACRGRAGGGACLLSNTVRVPPSPPPRLAAEHDSIRERLQGVRPTRATRARPGDPGDRARRVRLPRLPVRFGEVHLPAPGPARGAG